MNIYLYRGIVKLWKNKRHTRQITHSSHNSCCSTYVLIVISLSSVHLCVPALGCSYATAYALRVYTSYEWFQCTCQRTARLELRSIVGSCRDMLVTTSWRSVLSSSLARKIVFIKCVIFLFRCERLSVSLLLLVLRFFCSNITFLPLFSASSLLLLFLVRVPHILTRCQHVINCRLAMLTKKLLAKPKAG